MSKVENIEIYIKVTDERDYFILSPSKKKQEKKYMKLKWTILVLLKVQNAQEQWCQIAEQVF